MLDICVLLNNGKLIKKSSNLFLESGWILLFLLDYCSLSHELILLESLRTEARFIPSKESFVVRFPLFKISHGSFVSTNMLMMVYVGWQMWYYPISPAAPSRLLQKNQPLSSGSDSTHALIKHGCPLSASLHDQIKAASTQHAHQEPRTPPPDPHSHTYYTSDSTPRPPHAICTAKHT